MTARKASARGFTLIELLVVIAIIAILAAILFPVFAQAREKARQAQCISNLKQVGMGIMQYVQDYDESFPCNWYGALWPSNPNVNLSRYKWMDAIYPYVKNQGVFSCPSDSSTRKNFIYYQQLPAPSENNWGSYCTNVAYWDGNPGSPPSSDVSSRQTVTLAQLARPADTVWAADANGSFQCAWPNIAQQPRITGTSPRMLGFTGGGGINREGALMERHQSKVDVVWCDGHVSATNLDTLTERAPTGATAGAYRRFTVEDD